MEDAENRVRSQGDVREKARRAEFKGRGRGAVVWNDKGLEELGGEVRRVMGELKGGRPDWWGVLLWLCAPVGLAVAGWEWWGNLKGEREWMGVVERERAKL